MSDTTDTAALVERLRRYATALWHYEAADTIERQAARIAALEASIRTASYLCGVTTRGSVAKAMEILNAALEANHA